MDSAAPTPPPRSTFSAIEIRWRREATPGAFFDVRSPKGLRQRAFTEPFGPGTP